MLCQSAELFHPSGIAFNKYGNLFITDRDNNRVREIVFNTLGIQQATETNSDLLIYPNPATNYISIRSLRTMHSITVYNFLGELIYQEKINSMQYQIDLSNFRKGIYFLQTQTGYFKLIKE
jgi:hypothetical protein